MSKIIRPKCEKKLSKEIWDIFEEDEARLYNFMMLLDREIVIAEKIVAKTILDKMWKHNHDNMKTGCLSGYELAYVDIIRNFREKYGVE